MHLAEVLEAACDTMAPLGIYPLVFEADSNGAFIVATMHASALRTRSRGPYSPDNLPPEAIAMVERVALLWSVKPEKPEFTVEGGGRWPGLLVLLHASKVTVRFVVPEDAPPVPEPAPNNVGPSGDIKIALRFVAETLRTAAKTLGSEPPMSIRLTHPENPHYESERARLPADFRDFVQPVTPTIELDRSACSGTQLQAHDAAVRSSAYSDQRIEPLGRKGFTTWIGSACVRTAG
ncbi:hypothetical protein LWC34_13130 [Kibdelosporangium philippinense]|uniref:Uncharacterized protein n=1 Tax=Kibdelosporangium philippinense TaxID=211113 RepID=A0ABS8ZD59_9PSEU|nr:hypothetical protein [Kibdelosporangium philippinense]MCE7003762.1 hypothetical protein [Kibdelosporangium philippinense]